MKLFRAASATHGCTRKCAHEVLILLLTTEEGPEQKSQQRKKRHEQTHKREEEEKKRKRDGENSRSFSSSTLWCVCSCVFFHCDRCWDFCSDRFSVLKRRIFSCDHVWCTPPKSFMKIKTFLSLNFGFFLIAFIIIIIIIIIIISLVHWRSRLKHQLNLKSYEELDL